jgi:hypothetical protein
MKKYKALRCIRNQYKAGSCAAYIKYDVRLNKYFLINDHTSGCPNQNLKCHDLIMKELKNKKIISFFKNNSHLFQTDDEIQHEDEDEIININLINEKKEENFNQDFIKLSSCYFILGGSIYFTRFSNYVYCLNYLKNRKCSGSSRVDINNSSFVIKNKHNKNCKNQNLTCYELIKREFKNGRLKHFFDYHFTEEKKIISDDEENVMMKFENYETDLELELDDDYDNDDEIININK